VTEPLSPLHRAERALLDSETRLQQVLDNSSALVFAKDRHGRYLFVNREFEQVVGHTSTEIVGRDDEEVFPAELATRFRHNDLRVLHEKRAIEFEESGDFGAGPRTFLSSKFPLFDADGNAYAVCGIATDITDRKRLEEALSSAALAVSESEGEALFRELARYLAAILQVEAVFISTVDGADAAQMQVRAMHLDGRTVENFRYALAGTPCETVVGQQFRHYPSRLGELFPLDSDFRKLSFDSYAGHPLFDSSGRATGLLAVVSRRPIENPAFVESVLRIFAVRVNAEIERVGSAAALRASEASYREIFEASEDAILVYDWDSFAIVDANPQACRMYGYTRDELLRVGPGDISAGEPPYTGEAAIQWFELAKRKGSARGEWHRRSRDGSLHWDEVRLKSARIGGRQRVLAFSREITEAKLREQELRQSESRLRATATAALDSVVVMDHHGRIIEFNPAAETAFGHTRCNAIGRQLSEMMIPERHRDAHEIGLQRYLEGGPGLYLGRRIETCAVRADGSEFPVELAIGAAEGSDGPIFIGYLRDISERKEAEERRERLEAQLRQAQKMEAIGQLTGGIAHDFNNLLTSILGYVTLAAERDGALEDRRLAGYLSQAQRSCERARDLIQQMLMFSRGQRGSPKTLDLSSLVDDALENLRPTLPAGLTLVTGLDDAAPLVRTDPLQVEQVLLNLCINARDAIGEAGELTVTVGPHRESGLVCSGCRMPIDGSFVEMTVADTGHGMAPEIVDRIFEPFFSTKETGRGTGMGLAMVHGIVHEHGGHVVVESVSGRGSRFRVLWPAIPATGRGAAAPIPAASERIRGPRPELWGTVLVVDDEAAVGEFMRELLVTWGLDATYLPSPLAALELVSAQPDRFDVVVTDQAMPRMTGLELARALRERRADLPVVLYTGYGHGIAPTDVQAAGVRAMLAKPVDPAALESVLSGILGRGRGTGGSDQSVRPAPPSSESSASSPAGVVADGSSGTT